MTGLAILAVMAAVWAAIGLLWRGDPLVALAGPVLLSALIVIAARRPVRNRAPRTAEESKRIGKLIGFWTMAEGVGITVGANVLAYNGQQKLVPALIAVVVGLHFLPIARSMPLRLYYALGAAMIAAGLAGLRLIDGGTVAFICAGVLWATCLVMILQAAALPIPQRA